MTIRTYTLEHVETAQKPLHSHQLCQIKAQHKSHTYLHNCEATPMWQTVLLRTSVYCNLHGQAVSLTLHCVRTWLTSSALACTFGLTRCFAMPIFFLRLAHFCGATAKKADTSFDIGCPYFSSSCTLRCTAPNLPSISCALVLTCSLHRMGLGHHNICTLGCSSLQA